LTSATARWRRGNRARRTLYGDVAVARLTIVGIAIPRSGSPMRHGRPHRRFNRRPTEWRFYLLLFAFSERA
jgi:hypothetical protein